MSWDKIQSELSKTIAHSYYEPYIKPLILYKLNDKGVILIAPSITVKNVIEKRYLPVIEDSIRKVLGKKLKVDIQTKIEESGLAVKSDIGKLEDYDQNGELAIVQKYLNENFDFKYNLITEETVIKFKKDTHFKPITPRALNTIYINIKTNKKYKHINKDSLTILLHSEFVKDFHPVKEYFETVKGKWDGKTDLIKQLCNCIQVENPNMNFEEYFRKFTFRILHMLFSKRKFVNEHVFILQSPQDFRKNTFLSNIFPPNLEDYINFDTSKDFDDKDMSIIASKTWIHVWDEMDSLFLRSDLAICVKDFLSNYSKEKRRAYAEFSRKFKKMCSFFGLTNKKEFLSSEDGNRRYIIFRLLNPVNLDFYTIDIDTMWSQIYNQYLLAVGKNFSNESKIHWTEKQKEAIKENYLLHQKAFNETQYIEKYFEVLHLSDEDKNDKTHVWKTSMDIKEFLLNIHPKLNFYEGSIGKAMTRLGFYKNKMTADRCYLLKLKEAKLLKKFENE